MASSWSYDSSFAAAKNGDDSRNQQKSKVTDKQMQQIAEGVKFLADFKPEQSWREQRKLIQKSHRQKAQKGSLFDGKGQYRLSGVDVCDCLIQNCPGCHFPCSSCGSGKCGPLCRVNRKWAFDSVEHDGKDLILINKHSE